ncbi:hypothetical protein AGMMS50268_02690 [Spirochaetia bacterium]|nr:hypothetical protein AGMMS50268_02690 [Spirochaetia bacterium]
MQRQKKYYTFICEAAPAASHIFFKEAFYENLKEGMAISAYAAAFYVLYDSGSAGKGPAGGERAGGERAGKHNDPAAGGTC